MKDLKKYWIIFLLCGLVILMAIIKAKYGYNGEEIIEEGQTQRSAPTELPSPTPVPGFELLNKLPYQGMGFVVEKYINPNELAVKIKGIDKKLAEKMVWQWMEENKVATESYKLKISE